MVLTTDMLGISILVHVLIVFEIFHKSHELLVSMLVLFFKGRVCVLLNESHFSVVSVLAVLVLNNEVIVAKQSLVHTHLCHGVFLTCSLFFFKCMSFSQEGS